MKNSDQLSTSSDDRLGQENVALEERIQLLEERNRELARLNDALYKASVTKILVNGETKE